MDFSNLENALSELTSTIPYEVDFLTMLKFVALFAAGVLVIGSVGRVVLGKRSSLNHSVSSAMGILFIYVITILIYAFEHDVLSKFVTPLPFISFHGENLYIHAFACLDFPTICSQILSMIILAFLVNLLDTFIPKGQKVLSWYLLRFVTVVLAFLLHYGVSWVFNTFLPGVLVAYAPTILLGILIVMLILGVLNVLLGLVLTVVNPVFGAIYTFFFSNIIGKQVTKAVVTTILLCVLFAFVEHWGYTVICISTTYLGTYIPLVASLLVLWYLVGHVL